MKVKNLNFIERHVEKITLGVAAAGGLWLLYMAAQPATIEQGGQFLGPTEVESAVTTAVQELEAARAITAAMPESKLLGPESMVDWVKKWREIQNLPLPTALVNAYVPQFAPLNAPVTPIYDTPTGSKILTVNPPKLPAPTVVYAKAERGVVNIPAEGAAPAVFEGAGGPAIAAGTPQDLNWVVIGGRFPVLDFREAMANKGGDPAQAVPLDAQRITFYKVEVERQEKQAGVWGKWQPVAPSKASGPEIVVNLKGLPGDAVLKTLEVLDGQWKTVLNPHFYTTAKGELINPLVVGEKPGDADPKVKLELQKRLDELNRVGQPGRPGPVAPGLMPGSGMAEGDGLPHPAGAGAPAPLLGVPADLETVRKGMASVPFWFFDDTVKPEQSYRYQVRLKVFNPVFQMDKKIKLLDEAKRGEPWLTSDWVPVQNLDARPGVAKVDEVAINANQYIFFRPAFDKDRGVNVRVFKWSLGSWYVYEETVYPGQTIGGVRRLFQQDIDFTTGYTVVDVVKTNDDTQLVLLTPGRELVIRSAKVDSQNPKQQELDKIVVRKPAVPAAVKTPGRPGELDGG